MKSQQYISFLDLLGIKEMSKYNSLEYFYAMEKFRNKIIKSAKYFISNNKNTFSKVHFFSDCCFIQSNDLERILKFLAHLRKELLQDDDKLFFSASVTTGKLDAVVLGGESDENLDENIKEMIAKNEVSSYLSGTIFQSVDISKVYLQQTDFKGTGVYVDETCLEVWRKSFRSEESFQKKYSEFISQSFYFPSINTNTIKAYSDIKILKDENRDYYFNNLIEKYYTSNAKNKKHGRFYLSFLANWVSSSSYSQIEYDNEFDSLKEDTVPMVLKKLTTRNNVINEIKRTAHLFEYIYFFILKNIYEDRGTTDSVSNYFIRKVIYRNPKAKKILSNLDLLPDDILPPNLKEILIRENHEILVTYS